jgi:hypothetical protein
MEININFLNNKIIKFNFLENYYFIEIFFFLKIKLKKHILNYKLKKNLFR